MNRKDAGDFVTVITFGEMDSVAAHLALSRLDAAGLRCRLIGEHVPAWAGTIGPPNNPIYLQVASREVERAREILNLVSDRTG